MKDSFVADPEHLGVIFERCFDLCEVPFVFSSDCIFDSLAQISKFDFTCRCLVFPVEPQSSIFAN
jgi:hypothetical protein